MKDGLPRLNPGRLLAMQVALLLAETLPEAAAALRMVRGLALDWGGFDTIYAHVISNRHFSRKLEDLGLEHEAEQ